MNSMVGWMISDREPFSLSVTENILSIVGGESRNPIYIGDNTNVKYYHTYCTY